MIIVTEPTLISYLKLTRLGKQPLFLLRHSDLTDLTLLLAFMEPRLHEKNDAQISCKRDSPGTKKGF